MATVHRERDEIERLLSDHGGILRLEPCWVARDTVPPGRRLGLPDDAYDVGARGFICERWLASTTEAANAVGPPDEGLSWIAGIGRRLTLRDAVAAAPEAFMGVDHAATHAGLGHLAKLFDYAERLPYHLHPRAEHARRVGRNPKEEAYYFPEGFDLGRHPESFLGLHPSFADPASHERLLPYLVAWDSDLILRHAPAYLQVPDEGFHVPAGVPHAPGTALTVELQEDSDVFAMLQALNAGRIIPKRLLFHDVSGDDERALGERFVLGMIDWEASADPWFHARHHRPPIERRRQPGGREEWIFYGTTKFSGTKLTVDAGGSFRAADAGVHSLFVLRGSGRVGGVAVRGGQPGQDELIVTAETARTAVDVQNEHESEPLVLLKFFGPDIGADVPPAPVVRPEAGAA